METMGTMKTIDTMKAWRENLHENHGNVPYTYMLAILFSCHEKQGIHDGDSYFCHHALQNKEFIVTHVYHALSTDSMVNHGSLALISPCST